MERKNAGTVWGELGECAEISLVGKSRLVSVYRWHCLVDCAALTRERRPPTYVLTLVRSGAFVLRAGGKETVVDPSSAVLHAPGWAYGARHPFGCGDRGWHVAVRHEALRPEVEGEGEEEPRLPARTGVGPVPARALLAVRLLLDARQRGLAPDLLALEEIVLRLLAGWAAPAERQPRRSGTRELHEQCFERAKTVLFTRRRESLQLDELARAVHASPYHLSRLFQRAAGVSIHRYLNRLRLLDGLEAVASRRVSLTELALELGFSSHSHFTAAFHREFGLTPSRFRRFARSRTVHEAGRALGEALRLSRLP